MENCLYHGKAICTYDLKDENGIYYENMVLDWKQAAADRKLTCVECGAHVYLAAGPIKEPYFAHYDLENCDYGNGHESEELKKGKRLLYQLLKRSFPEGDIRARLRMENGMYSTLFCQKVRGAALAIDYRLLNNSLEKYRLRDSFYQENHIKPVYVMGIRQEKDTGQIDWYQSLLQSSMGYLAFLDTDKECITLKKSFGYRLGKVRKFQYCVKSYPISELMLHIDGKMICDFDDLCSDTEKRIMEEKTSYEKQQEQLRIFMEENLRHQEKEAIRLEAYRVRKEQEEKPRSGLNPEILERCRKMMEEGNAHLVSKKYYDAIMSEKKSKTNY